MKLLLIAATTLAAVIAAGCTDDSKTDTLTLEQYFAELERIGDDAEAAVDDIEFPDVAADASFEESRDALAQFFGASADIAEDAVDDIRGLNPPEDVEDEHDRYVGALENIPSISSDLEERIRDAETEDEYAEIVGTDDPFEEVGDEITNACEALQQIAEDNEIEVDLQCDE